MCWEFKSAVDKKEKVAADATTEDENEMQGEEKDEDESQDLEKPIYIEDSKY